jgi:hypothetical protein
MSGGTAGAASGIGDKRPVPVQEENQEPGRQEYLTDPEWEEIRAALEIIRDLRSGEDDFMDMETSGAGEASVPAEAGGVVTRTVERPDWKNFWGKVRHAPHLVLPTCVIDFPYADDCDKGLKLVRDKCLLERMYCFKDVENDRRERTDPAAGLRWKTAARSVASAVWRLCAPRGSRMCTLRGESRDANKAAYNARVHRLATVLRLRAQPHICTARAPRASPVSRRRQRARALQRNLHRRPPRTARPPLGRRACAREPPALRAARAARGGGLGRQPRGAVVGRRRLPRVRAVRRLQRLPRPAPARRAGLHYAAAQRRSAEARAR